MVDFNVGTKEELKLIHSIGKRAVEGNPSFNLMDLEMDILAVHYNGCKLKLKELLKATQFNFFHDVNGISLHIDRKTGNLLNCFLPRYSA